MTIADEARPEEHVVRIRPEDLEHMPDEPDDEDEDLAAPLTKEVMEENMTRSRRDRAGEGRHAPPVTIGVYGGESALVLVEPYEELPQTKGPRFELRFTVNGETVINYLSLWQLQQGFPEYARALCVQELTGDEPTGDLRREIPAVRRLYNSTKDPVSKEFYKTRLRVLKRLVRIRADMNKPRR